MRSNSILPKINVSIFFLIYGSILVVIGYKIGAVPVTHDEVGTALHYSNFSVWEIMQYPDSSPNNHILNTLLTKLFLLFGNEHWTIRLPNFLFFLLYTWAVFRILKTVVSTKSFFFIPGALLFVASPYLLDFFGLSRGYGISTALCMLSASYLITGFKLTKDKHIWIGLVLSALACYANFTLLVFWAAVSVLVLFYFIVKSRNKKESILKPVLLLIAINIGYLLLIAQPIIKMQSTDQFIYWTSNGFIEETISPLIFHSLYHSRIFLTTDSITYFVLALLIANVIYIVRKLVKSNYSKETLFSPITVATALILLTAFINIIQCWVLKTPNLNGRTALFFYPLFILTLITSHELFSGIKSKYFKLTIGVVVTFFCAHHLVTMIKLDSVREWAYDANTIEVLDYLKKEKETGQVSLATNWLFNPSFSYYRSTGKAPWLELAAYNKQIDANSAATYYYILADDYPVLENRYEPVLKFENENWLVRKR